jgi:hypothetical protein
LRRPPLGVKAQAKGNLTAIPRGVMNKAREVNWCSLFRRSVISYVMSAQRLATQ